MYISYSNEDHKSEESIVCSGGLKKVLSRCVLVLLQVVLSNLDFPPSIHAPSSSSLSSSTPPSHSFFLLILPIHSTHSTTPSSSIASSQQQQHRPCPLGTLGHYPADVALRSPSPLSRSHQSMAAPCIVQCVLSFRTVDVCGVAIWETIGDDISLRRCRPVQNR